MTPKTFGKQLLEIRTTLGLSQTEVAEAAEVSQSYVCQLEQDKFVPSITVVLRLAKALRASAPHRTGIEKAEVCIMKIKIGTVIENHLIYAIYGTEHCLARPILPDGEFVVWHIDEDGKGVWGGSYFPDQMDAERAYVTRCFPWLSDSVLFAASEEDDEIDETFTEFGEIDETFAEFPDLP